MEEKYRFVIVIPSYKNKQYCKKNILSAIGQKYSNFRVIYTDDCSPDGTADEVQSILDKYDREKKVTLVRNTERLGAMCNMYNMVYSCADDEIVVVLDGDDWLAHSGVLTRLSQEYSKGVWITYGQYRSQPDNAIGCSRSIPQNVIDHNSFRQFPWCSSHLRTYYAGLFKKIRLEDMKDNGKWLEMSSDLAAMFPMLEMAGPRQAFISDVLYMYNYNSPINDAKVNINLQQGLERKLRAMPAYSKLENL